MVKKNKQGMEAISHSLEEHFLVCGELLRFRTNSQALGQAAKDTLGCVDYDDLVTSANPLTIELFVQPRDPTELPAEINPATLPTFHMQRHLLTMTLDRSNYAVVDLLHGYSSGRLSPDAVEHGKALVRSLIYTCALNMLPLTRQMVPIHASCVAKDGFGVLFSSESGVGKSTLAMACVQRGYKLIADDAVFLRRAQSALQVTGMPCHIRLYPESLPLLLPLEGRREPEVSNPKGKMHIDPADFDPASKEQSASPGLMFYLAREHERKNSMIEKMTPDEVDRLLEIAWPYHLEWGEGVEENLNELQVLPAYQLHLGSDLDQTVALIDATVTEQIHKRNHEA